MRPKIFQPSFDLPTATIAERLKIGYAQYTPEMAAYWDIFINWEKRKEGEGTFFLDWLRKFRAKKILDFACGTGYDSVRLLEEGLRVKSCDGNLFMVAKARMNARDHRVKLDARICDWRRLKRIYGREKFDAILCLGNSFTHLFEEVDRRDVLEQVYGLLRKSGLFIVDQRNYDKILDRGLSSKHKYVYCGTEFDVTMKEKRGDRVRFLYSFGKLKFELELYPIRFLELRDLLAKTGFRIRSFGDFSKKFSRYGPDFFQHVCVKP